jgi:hypothetical protein
MYMRKGLAVVIPLACALGAAAAGAGDGPGLGKPVSEAKTEGSHRGPLSCCNPFSARFIRFDAAANSQTRSMSGRDVTYHACL